MSGTGRREVGETVQIVYLSSQPEIFVVQGIQGYSGLFIVFCILGIMIVVFLSELSALRQ